MPADPISLWAKSSSSVRSSFSIKEQEAAQGLNKSPKNWLVAGFTIIKSFYDSKNVELIGHTTIKLTNFC